MQIRIIDSNEFGKLNTADLEAFERSLRTTLPEPYRKFLIQHNGGYVEGAPQIAEVHGVYGLHNGPDHLRLQESKSLRRTIQIDSFPLLAIPSGTILFW